MLQVGDPVPAFREQPVFGLPVDVPGEPGADPLVLVFVRHLGSVFARATLAQLQTAFPDFDRQGVRVAAVTSSGLDVARDFVPRQHVLFPVICDPDGRLFDAFGVGKDARLTGTAAHMLGGGLATLADAVSHGQGVVDGDVRQLGAQFVVGSDGRIAHLRYPTSVADVPDLDPLLLAATAARPAAAAQGR